MNNPLPATHTLAFGVAILAGGLLSPHTYLDPGSGSYLLQLLIAALLGGLFVLKLSWGRIKSFFAKVFSRQRGEKEDE